MPTFRSASSLWLACVAVAALAASPVQATTTLTVAVDVALPLDGPGSPQSDFASTTGRNPTLPPISVSDVVDYNAATPTIFSGTASAEATPDSVRASTQFLADDLVPEVRSEGAFVTAFARSIRTFETFYGPLPADLWLSPIFAVDGTLQADPLVRSTVSLTLRAITVPVFSDQTLLDLEAPADGTPLVILGEETRVAPTPFGVGPEIDFTLDLRLSVETTMGLDPREPDPPFDPVPIPAGDYGGFANLGSTVTLLGFQVFEDEAGTRPFTGDIEIFDDDGNALAIIPAPEPGTGLLLALALAGVALAGRGSRERG